MGGMGQRINTNAYRSYVEVFSGNQKDFHGPEASEDRNQVIIRWEGDQTIIRQFESECDCTGFFKNRFFWDDCFKSMEVCSKDTVAQSRPTWVEVYGVPLHYWNTPFFHQLGRVLGTPLLIEEDTIKKGRLDRGRLLDLLPFDSTCLEKIKVKEQLRSFKLLVVKDSSSVDHEWIRRHLELRDEKQFPHSNAFLESESYVRPLEKIGARVPEFQNIPTKSNSNFRTGFGSQKDCQQKEAKRDVNTYLNRLNLVEAEEGYDVMIVVENGMKILQEKFKIRHHVPHICNMNLNLEKPRVIVSSEENFRASNSDYLVRTRCPFGECSKAGQGVFEIVFEPSMKRTNSQAHLRMVPFIEAYNKLHQELEEVGDATEKPVAEEFNEEKIGHPSKLNTRKGTRMVGSVRTHAMKIRNKKDVREGSWDLKTEFTKAIERQYYNKKGLLGNNMDFLSMKEEITKVLETGVAVGFEFEGRKEDFGQDAHEFLNFWLNELVDILEKESQAAKSDPETSSPTGKTANGPKNGQLNGVRKEPLVTWNTKKETPSFPATTNPTSRSGSNWHPQQHTTNWRPTFPTNTGWRQPSSPNNRSPSNNSSAHNSGNSQSPHPYLSSCQVCGV
ncbi:hypothetical protein LWI28_006087 [Acer negundo]|uniref:DUF4283 domain-containing protein n=1 Tax=Acer negundo TaxID=4023 RepID=A0AAD5NLC6_ACENE|nr:hypothetical protein LWI28_006087 [Acer negundo]